MNSQTIIAFILGALSWRLYSYWRRLLGQPLFSAMPLRREVEGSLSKEAEALLIAEADVRAAIEQRRLPNGRRLMVLCAGLRHFREPWARDFGFASFGLVEMNEVRALKETLLGFLATQREDGQFPVKLHSTGIVDRYLHALLERQQPVYAPMRPKYRTAHDTVSLDGNALLVIAALNYLRHFEDDAFVEQHWPALKRALAWLERQALEEDGLLHQGPFTDWADSIARSGLVHYTNVLYWKAVHDFAESALKYDYHNDYMNFSAREARLKQVINETFWREDLGYYVVGEQIDILSSDGNLLAVAWKLASKEQANSILDKLQAYEMASPVPTQVTNRPYEKGFVALENRLAGIPHYHTAAAWLWLGAWHIIALARQGRMDEARVLVERISTLIVRDRVVHEVYDRSGRFLSTFWYTSEAPLTWSAGMVVHAFSVFHRRESEVV